MYSTDTISNKPRKTTDGAVATCNHCGQVAYEEMIVGELQADGTYAYHRQVRGGFTQQTDAEGNPLGPVIPKCFCQE